MTIPETTGVALAFGDTTYLPKWEDIPEEFKERKTKWNKLFSRIFYSGSHGIQFKMGDPHDFPKVIRALKAIMISFEPKHEHKEAGVAYLMSQWFEDWSESGESTQQVVSSEAPQQV